MTRTSFGSSGSATTTLNGRSLTSLIVPSDCHRGVGSPGLSPELQGDCPVITGRQAPAVPRRGPDGDGRLAGESGIDPASQRREVARRVQTPTAQGRGPWAARLSGRDGDAAHRQARDEVDGATHRTVPGLHGAALHSEDVSSRGAGPYGPGHRQAPSYPAGREHKRRGGTCWLRSCPGAVPDGTDSKAVRSARSDGRSLPDTPGGKNR